MSALPIGANGTGYKPPGKSDKTISHREALRVLLAHTATEAFSEHIRAELPAIISHWLHSANDDPLIVDRNYAVEWRTTLYSYIANAFRSVNGRRGEFFRINPQTSTVRPARLKIDFTDIPFPAHPKPRFTFVDLFAGIGGFRIALQHLGGKCVFSSEFNQSATETYFNNFGEIPFGDINKFSGPEAFEPFARAIPRHNILTAGFPCQPFSQAGRQLGFNDARGTLFFNILEILRRLGPKSTPEALILENVKRFRTHDGGNTHRVVVESLRQRGYKVYSKILRAHEYGVAQNRERIFIVAFKKPLAFEYPKPCGSDARLHNELKDAFEPPEAAEDYTITRKMWEGHKARRASHQARGNGFGYSLFTGNEPYANTISARYYKDGSEILISKEGESTPRVLMPEECSNLQGFPRTFKVHPSDKEAWQQSGNSVAVPVVSAIAKQVLEALRKADIDRSCSDPYDPVVL